jgi:soluble lytic murein transglycosylase
MVSSMRLVTTLLSLAAGTAAFGASQSTPVLQPVAPVQSLPAYSTGGDIYSSLADWRRLRQSSGYAFRDYAYFLLNNPGWPGESGLRKSAEKAMRPGEDAATVAAFFRTTAPTTANGFTRFAEALAAQGRQVEALAAARSAWSAAGLAAGDETALWARFGSSFTTLDMDKRVDRLLTDRDTTNAARLLGSTSPARRPVFQARLAMLGRDPAAETYYNAVQGLVTSDGGLMFERARYFKDAGWTAAMRSLLARPHAFVQRPIDTERWMELQLEAARGAAAERQSATAYNIARQVDDALPAGADVALQPLGVRDDYTSLTWLAGTLAHRSMGRPGDAVGLFERYSRGGRSLQVATKGNYWAGRAAAQAGRQADATAYFTRAAAYPDLFYGQLALERLGRAVPAPAPLAQVPVTMAERQAFANKRLVRALPALAQQGRRDEQTLFVRALSEAVETQPERVLATELARQIGRQDLAVWTARSSRNNGAPFYFRESFPALNVGLSDPRLWSIAHGITRQESSFDRNALSPVGARGMMQLMPGTAQEQAGKMGLGYDWSRLTTDPSYNVMLGSAYFARLLDTWNGNYPLAVASYNAGAGNVRKWIRNNGDPRAAGGDIVSWIEDIPFSETRGYVQRVLENSVVYDRIAPTTGQAPRQLSYFLGKSRAG